MATIPSDPKRLAKGMWWMEALWCVGGCTKVSPACKNCWALEQTDMRSYQQSDAMQKRYGG
ncbi:hypothetical protein LCGC14_2989100, partial [marine sediment metagenome]